MTNTNKTFTNISKLSPTHSVSNFRHHHRWSRIFHCLKSNSWILLKDAILKKELRKNDVLFDPKKYGIQEESTNLDYRRKFSFSAFVDSIANSTLGKERMHDHHWMSQFYHCRVRIVEVSSRMTIIPYWRILENSSRERKFLPRAIQAKTDKTVTLLYYFSTKLLCFGRVFQLYGLCHDGQNLMP